MKAHQLLFTLGSLKDPTTTPSQAIGKIDSGIVRLFNPYRATKDLGKETRFEGIFFDENGITATNQGILLHIKTKTEYRGIYRPNGQPIHDRIPSYGLPIEYAFLSNTIHYKTNIVKLDSYLKSIESIIPPDSSHVTFIVHKQHIVCYDFFFLSRIINTLLSEGVKKADFFFRPDESVETQALIVQTKFEMGEANLLLMPLRMEGSIRQLAAKGIAHKNYLTSQSATGFFSFEINDTVSTIPKFQDIQKERSLRRMEIKAEALEKELILELKLLTI